MSIHVSSMVWKLKGISPAQRIVLLALADTADDDGECWPGLKCVTEKTGIGRRSVNIHLQAVVDRGIVKAIPRYREDGSQTSNLYRFDMNALAPVHEAVPPVEAPIIPPLRPSAGPLDPTCKGILDPSENHHGTKENTTPRSEADSAGGNLHSAMIASWYKAYKEVIGDPYEMKKADAAQVAGRKKYLEAHPADFAHPLVEWERRMAIYLTDDWRRDHHQVSLADFAANFLKFKDQPLHQETRNAERRPSAGSPVTPEGAAERAQAWADAEQRDRDYMEETARKHGDAAPPFGGDREEPE